eukprot:scaffold264002_cov15-Tisochrysis_lutea.AAC.1
MWNICGLVTEDLENVSKGRKYDTTPFPPRNFQQADKYKKAFCNPSSRCKPAGYTFRILRNPPQKCKSALESLHRDPRYKPAVCRKNCSEFKCKPGT